MTDEKRPLKVFLCYASADKPQVRELYQRLKNEGWIDPWLDEEKLTLGQHWTTVIETALDDADVVIVFLSQSSVQKEGFVQRELNYAWDLSLEKPREVIFLIPFRLDDCEVPRHLRSRQWGDYFGEKKDETYKTLLKSLKIRHEQKLGLEAVEAIHKNDALNTIVSFSVAEKSNVIDSIPPNGVVPSSSLRLKQALALINDAKNALEKITVPRVAQFLDVPKISEVEACFEGKAEASVFFLEKFADFFGVNQQWLQFGEGHPFETIEDPHIDPSRYYAHIKALNAQEIIFAREISPAGRTAILLRLSEYKFAYFPNEYNVSSRVGGTGRFQLANLYRLIEKIDTEGLPYSSRLVPIKDFGEFTEGDVFPGKIADFPISYWATDFLSSDFSNNPDETYDAELRRAHKIVQAEIGNVAQQSKIEQIVIEQEKSATKSEVAARPSQAQTTTHPRKLKTEYIIAIIGAAATILAALIGILPQIITPTLVPTSTSTLTATTFTETPTVTLTVFTPRATPNPNSNKIPHIYCYRNSHAYSYDHSNAHSGHA